jgi:acyl-CoA thioesterase I
MKYPSIIFLFLISILFVSCSRDIKITCIGDSITEGSGLADQSKNAYPAKLDSILGPGYSVLNCGRSAATLQKKGDLPFWACNEFSNVFAFNPDIIVIKLGTNDTKSQNWNAQYFAKDYQALIDTFNTIPGKPRLFLCLPVPVFKSAWGINDSTLTSFVIPIINNIASKNKLPVIDLYKQMKAYGKNFPDGVHPDAGGANIMAGIIAREIKKQHIQ